MGDTHIIISVRNMGDRAEMRSEIQHVVRDYSTALRQVRDGLRTAVFGDHRDIELVINPALMALDAVVEERDVSKVQNLLPFIDWLNANQGHPIAGILGDTAAQGTLNYLIDGIFKARMMGAADTVGEQEMEAMIRFYAGNIAQTSEGSWKTNNTMLFVFGERILNTLAKKVPDRVNAFYKAVQDARKSAQRGPGSDEEEIPEADRPTTEQLRAYEASFSRLERLATTGLSPKNDLPSQAAVTQASSLPPAVPTVQPASKASEVMPATTSSDKLALSKPWSIIIVLIVAATGLLWLRVKSRK